MSRIAGLLDRQGIEIDPERDGRPLAVSSDIGDAAGRVLRPRQRSEPPILGKEIEAGADFVAERGHPLGRERRGRGLLPGEFGTGVKLPAVGPHPRAQRVGRGFQVIEPARSSSWTPSALHGAAVRQPAWAFRHGITRRSISVATRNRQMPMAASSAIEANTRTVMICALDWMIM